MSKGVSKDNGWSYQALRRDILVVVSEQAFMSAGTCCNHLGGACSRQSYGNCEGEMWPNPASSWVPVRELLWLSKQQEYREEEAVGYQKLLEGTYKKSMLEGLLLVLLGSKTSFLSFGSLTSLKEGAQVVRLWTTSVKLLCSQDRLSLLNTAASVSCNPATGTTTKCLKHHWWP